LNHQTEESNDEHEQEDKADRLPANLPSVEEIQNESATAESINDFFGKDGIFAHLFADTRRNGSCLSKTGPTS
jgi:hypothetical protein